MSFETMSKESMNVSTATNLVTMTVLVPVWEATAAAHELPRTGEYVCGSNQECDIAIPLKGVASQHCSIYNHNGITTVVPQPNNNVWVNEVAISSPERLYPGDSLAIGPATFKVDQRQQLSAQQPVGSRIDDAADSSANQALMDQIQRLESQVAEAKTDSTSAVKSPSAAFEARFLSKLPTAPVVSSRREQDLTNREEELDRRSEMLQQQLAMFKTRLRQQQQQDAASQTQIEEARTAFETEREGMLAELQKGSEQQKAEIEKQEKLIGQRSAALQRKQAGLEKAAEKVAQERAEQERVLAELEKVREQEQADLQAQRAQVSAELDKLNQSIAEIAEHHQDAKSSTERLRTREVELDGFQEELRHRHESIEATSKQLQQQQSELEATRAAVEQQAQKLHADRQNLQSDFDERQHATQDKANAVAELETKLQQQAAELEQNAADFRLQSEAAKTTQEQQAKDLQQQQAALEEQRQQLDSTAAAVNDRQQQLADRETELNTLQQQLDQRDQNVADTTAEEVTALREELNQRDLVATAKDTAIAEANKQLKATQTELQAVLQQLEQQNVAAATDAEQQIADLRASLKERDEALKTFESEIAETREALVAQESEFNAQEHDVVKEAQAFSAELEQQLADAREQLEQKEQALLELQQKAPALDELDARNAECDAREADVQQQVATIQKQADRLANMAAEIDQQKADLEKERQSLTSQPTEAADDQHTVQKQAELDKRHAELEAWAQELDARNDEVADRIQQVKKLAAEPRTEAPASDTPSVAQSFEFQQQVENARRQTELMTSERDQLVVERDQLTLALNELKTAFESARDEMAANAAADTSSDSVADAEQERLLAERSAEVELANQRLLDSESKNHQLSTELEEANERLRSQEQLAEQRIAEATAEANNSGDSEAELQLLQQLEDLKAEMASASAPEGPAAELANKLIEHEQTIEQLQEELEQSRQSHAAADNAGDDSSMAPEQIAIIEELKSRLEQQEQTINELNASNGSTEPGDQQSVEEAERLHRELDERTNLLDVREGELRERQRMLEQSTTDIEEQRRALLEARQQLELARAEIQLAAEPSVPVASQEPAIPSAVSLLNSENDLQVQDDHEEEEDSDVSTLAVRSEIAELFGLGDQQPETQSPIATHSDLPAVDEYSQEESAAVSMSFSQGGNVLLEAPATPEREESFSDGEDDGDDFVASYMEQLLARNRSSAGGSLPAELKSEPKAKTEPKPEKPKPVGQKSFIDAYMSGEYDANESGAAAQVVDEAPVEELAAPSEPRAKIDLQSLRNDMNSFRELSTKSVENALASHAKRQVRGGITTRITVFLSLLVVTLFVLCAALIDVIPFGVMCWIAIIATAVSGIELALKMSKLKKKVQGSTLGGDPRTNDQVAADAASLKKPATEQQQSKMYGPEGAEASEVVEEKNEAGFTTAVVDSTPVTPKPTPDATVAEASDEAEELDEECFEV